MRLRMGQHYGPILMIATSYDAIQLKEIGLQFIFTMYSVPRVMYLAAS
jgi:hypothetical protein